MVPTTQAGRAAWLSEDVCHPQWRLALSTGSCCFRPRVCSSGISSDRWAFGALCGSFCVTGLCQRSAGLGLTSAQCPRVCPVPSQPAPASPALSVGGERGAPSSEERPGDLGSEDRQPSQSHPVRFPSRPWRPPSTGCPSSTPSSTPWRSMSQSQLSSTTKNT